jgi:hypothetical protein
VQHYDDETIAMLAMGESQVTADNDAHLSACSQCRNDVEQLRTVVLMGRELKHDYAPVSPPAQVWTRIVDELGLTDTQADVVPLNSKPARRALSLGIAAAVGLILGAGGMWALSPSRSTQAQPVAVATASLAPLDIPNTSGLAILQAKAANQRAVSVEVSNLPLEAGKFYEVWLMDPSDQHLVALGVLGVDGRGAYVVPAGLDLSRYTAIDVSLQPMNGSPLHSSVSAVRGIMKA